MIASEYGKGDFTSEPFSLKSYEIEVAVYGDIGAGTVTLERELDTDSGKGWFAFPSLAWNTPTMKILRLPIDCRYRIVFGGCESAHIEIRSKF